VVQVQVLSVPQSLPFARAVSLLRAIWETSATHRDDALVEQEADVDQAPALPGRGVPTSMGRASALVDLFAMG
jgi:hypothetical protein